MSQQAPISGVDILAFDGFTEVGRRWRVVHQYGSMRSDRLLLPPDHDLERLFREHSAEALKVVVHHEHDNSTVERVYRLGAGGRPEEVGFPEAPRQFFGSA